MKFLKVFLVTLILSSFFWVHSMFAEEWKPSKITLAISHDVNSNFNQITLELVKSWKKYLDTDFVMDNKGQSSGRLAYEQFVNAPNDGTTVMLTNFSVTSIMYAQQKPEAKWEDYVDPINTFAKSPGAMLVNSDSKYSSFKQIIEDAQTQKITAGVARFASPDTLLVYEVMEKTGAQFELVPLGSGGKTRTAIMGGHIVFGARRPADVIASGHRLKALCINADENTVKEVVGDIPTIDEDLGIDLLNVDSLRGLALRKGLKEKYPGRYKILVESFAKAIKDPEYIEATKKLGIEDVSSTSPEKLNDTINKYMMLYTKYSGNFKEN